MGRGFIGVRRRGLRGGRGKHGRRKESMGSTLHTVVIV